LLPYVSYFFSGAAHGIPGPCPPPVFLAILLALSIDNHIFKLDLSAFFARFPEASGSETFFSLAFLLAEIGSGSRGDATALS